MKKFIGNDDPISKDGFALQPPDYVDSVVLTGSAVQFTVPIDARYVVFSSGGDFYVSYGDNPTAEEPSGTTSDGSASELNPAVRRLDGVDKISIIGSSSVTLAYYA